MEKVLAYRGNNNDLSKVWVANPGITKKYQFYMAMVTSNSYTKTPCKRGVIQLIRGKKDKEDIKSWNKCDMTRAMHLV